MASRAGVRGKILLVEDEILIRCLVEDILADAGYEVIAFHCPEEAIAAIAAQHASLTLLISDVNLGRGMRSGWEVAREARLCAPSLPVVYLSANSTDEWRSEGVAKSILIEKPFFGDQLLDQIWRLLASGKSSGASPASSS